MRVEPTEKASPFTTPLARSANSSESASPATRISTISAPRPATSCVGVPVATMGIGKSGAANAAVLAVEILALSDDELAKKLHTYKSRMEKAVADSDARIRETLTISE